MVHSRNQGCAGAVDSATVFEHQCITTRIYDLCRYLFVSPRDTIVIGGSQQNTTSIGKTDDEGYPAPAVIAADVAPGLGNARDSYKKNVVGSFVSKFYTGRAHMNLRILRARKLWINERIRMVDTS